MLVDGRRQRDEEFVEERCRQEEGMVAEHNSPGDKPKSVLRY